MADRPVVQMIANRRGGGVYAGPGSQTYEDAKKIAQAKQANEVAARELAVQKEQREAAQGEQTRRLQESRLDFDKTHAAAQESLAQARESQDAALKGLQIASEYDKITNNTRIMNDATGYLQKHSLIVKGDPDYDNKMQWLDQTFPNARLNPEVAKIRDAYDKEQEKATTPTAQDFQLMKYLNTKYGNEDKGIEGSLNAAISAGGDGALPAQLMKDAYYGALKRMAGTKPSEEMQPIPPAVPPAQTSASTSVPETPAASTPKEQQVSDWAGAQAPTPIPTHPAATPQPSTGNPPEGATGNQKPAVINPVDLTT
jgi:hypothetical protein